MSRILPSGTLYLTTFCCKLQPFQQYLCIRYMCPNNSHLSTFNSQLLQSPARSGNQQIKQKELSDSNTNQIALCYRILPNVAKRLIHKLKIT